MEKDTSYELEVTDSPKVENDSMASGNPEDHGDSNHIETVPEESDQNDQVEENEDKDKDTTGVI